MEKKNNSISTTTEQFFYANGERQFKNLTITKKEAAKVIHDINSVWHSRFSGKRFCRIETHSHRKDSPSYVYHFINHGFNQYEFVGKYPTQEEMIS